MAPVSQDLISCIVPAYNAEQYLTEALESIFAQSYAPLEIILVDDGSTDGTERIATGYGDRIIYLRQANAGPAAARNRGLRAARGDFIAFLDADDVWHTQKLSRQMSRFQLRPGLGLCVTYVQNFWVAEMKNEAAHFQSHRRSKPLPGYVTQSLLARRQIFESVGLFDASLKHGDAQEWFIRAAEKETAMEILPDVLVYRRLHEQNFSRHVSESHDAHLWIIKRSLDRRRNRNGGMVQTYEFCNFGSTGSRLPPSRRGGNRG